MKFLFSIFLICLINGGHSDENVPRVKTPLGGIKGYYKVSHGGRKFEAYEGVPYAIPPVGKFRFKPPQRTPAWPGDLAATKYDQDCLQYHILPKDTKKKVVGAEDCLYLNIYVPPRPNNEVLPVLFYIHGGCFQYGAGSKYGPKFVMDRDVILVTINYRLGPFGFLSTEDEIMPGNMGLKDQSMALRWVSENIEWFGGDPAKITITGLSAGGASVHYHYLSPMSAGLFQAGISFSGSALNSWPQAENALEKAKKLAATVGCPVINNREMVRCLRYRPAQTISQATEEFQPWLYNPFSPFGPVPEKYGDQPFITHTPVEIINNKEVYDAPWVVGVTSEEGLFNAAEFIADKKFLEELNSKWEDFAPHLLDFNYTIPTEKHAEVAKLIKKHYIGSKPIDSSTINQLVQMVGDRIFVVDEEKAARMQAKANSNPVWFYYYTYRATNSLSDALSGTKQKFGVSHGDDMYLIMENALFDPTKSKQDMAMLNDILDFVMSVVNNKKPKYGNMEWPKVDPADEKLTYMSVEGPGKYRIVQNDNLGQKKFWNSIRFNENILNRSNKKIKDEF